MEFNFNYSDLFSSHTCHMHACIRPFMQCNFIFMICPWPPLQHKMERTTIFEMHLFSEFTSSQALRWWVSNTRLWNILLWGARGGGEGAFLILNALRFGGSWSHGCWPGWGGGGWLHTLPTAQMNTELLAFRFLIYQILGNSCVDNAAAQ
jgi:hypothetical protein